VVFGLVVSSILVVSFPYIYFSNAPKETRCHSQIKNAKARNQHRNTPNTGLQIKVVYTCTSRITGHTTQAVSSPEISIATGAGSPILGETGGLSCMACRLSVVYGGQTA
jgi:hypothetical protein